LLPGLAILLGGCGSISVGDLIPGSSPSAPSQPPPRSAPARSRSADPALTGSGNAAVARNPCARREMALAEFNSPDIELLVKDDGAMPRARRPPPSRRWTRAPRSSGPLFALTVGPVGQVARAAMSRSSRSRPTPRGGARRLSLTSCRSPMSTASSATPRARANDRSPRSFPTRYGTVVEAALRAWCEAHGRVVALERYPLDKAQMQARRATSPRRGQGGRRHLDRRQREGVATAVQTLTAAGIDAKKMQLLAPAMGGRADLLQSGARRAWYAGPIRPASAISPAATAAIRPDPVRTASLLRRGRLVAALVKTRQQRSRPRC